MEAVINKRKLGEVWFAKDDLKKGRKVWKVQFQHGINTYPTKRLANIVSEAFYPKRLFL